MAREAPKIKKFRDERTDDDDKIRRRIRISVVDLIPCKSGENIIGLFGDRNYINLNTCTMIYKETCTINV